MGNNSLNSGDWKTSLFPHSGRRRLRQDFLQDAALLLSDSQMSTNFNSEPHLNSGLLGHAHIPLPEEDTLDL